MAATGGEVIELRGDEALCVFPSARQALRGAPGAAAVRFQARVEDEPVFPLGIGIGSRPVRRCRWKVATAVRPLNLAARLCNIATPGQILASEMVTGLAGTLEGLRFVERRRVRVKGLEKPVRVIEIVPSLAPPGAAGGPSSCAPARLALARCRSRRARRSLAAALVLTRDSGETGGGS